MLNIKPKEKSLVSFSQNTESSAFLTTYLELITHWKAISWPYCFNTELLWPCGGREQKSSGLNLCLVMTDKRPQKKHKLKNRKISSEALYKQSQIFTVGLTVNRLALLLWLSHMYFLCKHRWLSNTARISDVLKVSSPKNKYFVIFHSCCPEFVYCFYSL